jgi:hypothetical protein
MEVSIFDLGIGLFCFTWSKFRYIPSVNLNSGVYFTTPSFSCPDKREGGKAVEYKLIKTIILNIFDISFNVFLIGSKFVPETQI